MAPVTNMRNAGSINFEHQNKVKTAPQAIFAQKAFAPLCIPTFSPFMAQPNISLRFRVTGRTVKISVFHWFPCPSAKKSFGLDFDATNLPHSQFEPLYPNVFRDTLKVDFFVISLASSTLQSQHIQKVSIILCIFRGVFWKHFLSILRGVTFLLTQWEAYICKLDLTLRHISCFVMKCCHPFSWWKVCSYKWWISHWLKDEFWIIWIYLNIQKIISCAVFRSI